jgi:hypothetical protein
VRRDATTAVLAVAAVSLLLGGCTSSEKGTATAAPASASSTSAGASSSPESSSSSASASGDLTAWAASFCSAAKPISDATSTIGDPSAADMSTPDGAKAYIVGIYSTFASAFTDTATAISTLDAPPVDGAEDFVPKAAAAFTAAGQTFQGLADQASAVDLTDPSALQALTGGLSTMSDPFQGAFTELEASTPAELDSALTNTPECAALGK